MIDNILLKEMLKNKIKTERNRRRKQGDNIIRDIPISTPTFKGLSEWAKIENQR